MGAKLIRVGGYSVGRLPNKYRDWVIELCLLVWVGSLAFVRIMGWGDDAPLMVEVIFEILNIVVVAVVWKRLQKMLPRRCWRTVTIYSLLMAVVSLAVSAGYYYYEDAKFTTAMFVVTVIFLVPAAFGAYMWRRRVVKGAEIIQRRAMKAKRRKITY